MLADLTAGAVEDAEARAARRPLADVERDALAQAPALDALAALAPAERTKIIAEVKRLAGLFPTGLIISPSHEAILPDTPPANVEAIFTGVHSL